MNQVSFGNYMQDKNIEILQLIEIAAERLKMHESFKTLNIIK